MTVTKLIANQSSLQKQAFAIVEELNLNSILRPYGQFSLVGSLEYGLMTWRDIDANLVMKAEPTNSDYWEIVKIVFNLPKVKLITLADNRHHMETNRPRSMYIGIKYDDDDDNTWRIDIRLLSKESIASDGIMQMINEKITEELRLAILRIKTQVCDNPKYHKAFSSVDIYEAVLLSDVRDLAGFRDYLAKQGRNNLL